MDSKKPKGLEFTFTPSQSAQSLIKSARREEAILSFQQASDALSGLAQNAFVTGAALSNCFSFLPIPTRPKHYPGSFLDDSSLTNTYHDDMVDALRFQLTWYESESGHAYYGNSMAEIFSRKLQAIYKKQKGRKHYLKVQKRVLSRTPRKKRRTINGRLPKLNKR